MTTSLKFSKSENSFIITGEIIAKFDIHPTKSLFKFRAEGGTEGIIKRDHNGAWKIYLRREGDFYDGLILNSRQNNTGSDEIEFKTGIAWISIAAKKFR